MNVRIDPRAVRVRLLVSEIVRLASEGSLVVRLEFAPGVTAFACRVESAPVPDPVAKYDDGCVTVKLPEAFVASWPANDVIGATTQCGNIAITVEKDLRRVKPWRADADDIHRFPNPRGNPIQSV